MSYSTLNKNVEKIPDSLNDPYNLYSYKYIKEDFVPFDTGGRLSNNRINTQIAQQQAQQAQIIRIHKQQELQEQEQEQEQKEQKLQKILNLQIFQKAQDRNSDRNLQNLNKQIANLNRLIAANYNF